MRSSVAAAQTFWGTWFLPYGANRLRVRLQGASKEAVAMPTCEGWAPQPSEGGLFAAGVLPSRGQAWGCELTVSGGLPGGAGIPRGCLLQTCFSRVLALVAEWVCLDASSTPSPLRDGFPQMQRVWGAAHPRVLSCVWFAFRQNCWLRSFILCFYKSWTCHCPPGSALLTPPQGW